MCVFVKFKQHMYANEPIILISFTNPMIVNPIETKRIIVCPC